MSDLADIKRARMRDGVELSYRIIPGTGSARFVLIHSLAMDMQFWAPVAERLAGVGDVLIYDCRGHGASGRGGAPYSAAQFADDLAELLAVIGWDDIILAGASMGGCIAIAFTARYCPRVLALGLVDTTACYGPAAPAQWEERAQKALTQGLGALVGFQTSRWFSAGFAAANPEVVQGAIDVFLATDRDAYAETCRMLGRVDERAALQLFAMPTRILVGSDDYATPPAMAEAMQQTIAGAKLTVLDGAAHLTPLERVDDVAAALLALNEDIR
ncbi:alpha/beta fold hydrolase [Sphingomonas oligophenolica]|uniref:Alpha/beta fold hydrolase n=1 Tax=Sphingomonas oligophenolica TaxID=301154 RepID=A0A502C8W6_9SPHN|nr:alpha/beta fold hydrolase [Sphingomonas oligophenolica]TPG08449.1 alpha/beta fold hydrolase [Sphingomonas oligophenolica]